MTLKDHTSNFPDLLELTPIYYMLSDILGHRRGHLAFVAIIRSIMPTPEIARLVKESKVWF